MSSRPRTGTYGILAAVGLGVLATMVPSWAGSKGRRNTAIVLGGVAAYHLAKGHTKSGLLAAGATAYAYKRMQDAKKSEKRRDAWQRRHYARVRAYRSHKRHVVRTHRARRVSRARTCRR